MAEATAWKTPTLVAAPAVAMPRMTEALVEDVAVDPAAVAVAAAFSGLAVLALLNPPCRLCSRRLPKKIVRSLVTILVSR